MTYRSAAEGIIDHVARDAPRGFRDCRRRQFIALGALGRAHAQISLTDAHRGDFGRDLSRPQCRRKVLGGEIARGVTDRIDAVLCFSDLHNYTRISDTEAPEHIIALLNEYTDAILSVIHKSDGDVVKLMGDGTPANFTVEDRSGACHAARSVAVVNHRRAAESLPFTDMYLGLPVGEVLCGNIGSRERLDFTVVGQAVNEVSHIAGLCRSVDQLLLISSALASAIGELKELLVSVGRYALLSDGCAQDLCALEPNVPN